MKKLTTNQIRSIFKCRVEDQNMSLRNIEKRTQISKSTISQYIKKAQDENLYPLAISVMSDREIELKFGLKTEGEKSFIEPDFNKVLEYIDSPKVSGRLMPSLKDAWHYLYVKQCFPNYTTGALPSGCMSLSTFQRYYNNYLKENRILMLSHMPSPNLNFGAGSVMEIDTIGDKYIFFDRQNVKHTTKLFTAVLKYSGMIYAEASERFTTEDWCRCITNAVYFFGGVTEVIRGDNDTAISIHGNKKKGTKSRLKPIVLYLYKQLHATGELCPIRTPEYKGLDERSNRILNEKLFRDPEIELPVRNKDLKEFNNLILSELEKINNDPRAHGQLSRKALFELREKQHLKPLPRIRPVCSSVKAVNVRYDGYVMYKNHFYYAGAERINEELLLVASQGQDLSLLTLNTYENVASYQINSDLLGPSVHYKADKFKSEAERAVSRKLDFYLEKFSNKTVSTKFILQYLQYIWSLTPNAPATAGRECNRILSLYEHNRESLELIDYACELVIKKDKDITFSAVTQTFSVLRNANLSRPQYQQSSADTDSTVNTAKSANTRGGNYYG